jgi:hypothetical protein
MDMITKYKPEEVRLKLNPNTVNSSACAVDGFRTRSIGEAKTELDTHTHTHTPQREHTRLTLMFDWSKKQRKRKGKLLHRQNISIRRCSDGVRIDIGLRTLLSECVEVL